MSTSYINPTFMNQKRGKHQGERCGRSHVGLMRIFCDQDNSPESWFAGIVDAAPQDSQCNVMFNLFNAFLHTAGWKRKDEEKSFRRRNNLIMKLRWVVYCITEEVSISGLRQFRSKHNSGRTCVLLVPKKSLAKAEFCSKKAGASETISIFSFESFLGMSLLNLAMKRRQYPFNILRKIIIEYNRLGAIAGAGKRQKIKLLDSRAPIVGTKETPNSGIAAFFGALPGDEIDEELLTFLKELRR